MFDLVHAMRTRIITARAFDGSRVLGAILFEQTMDRQMAGVSTVALPVGQKQVVPFLKVDKGLADEQDGVQLMKPMPDLDALLERATEHRIFGTKMRSVIKDADKDGIAAIVDQQFEIGRRKSPMRAWCRSSSRRSASTSPHKEQAETLLHDALAERLARLPADAAIMFKLTIPSQVGRYADLADDRGCCACWRCPAATAETRRASCSRRTPP